MASDKRKRKEVDELESTYRTIAERKQGKFAKKHNQKGKQKTVFIIISIFLMLCIVAGIAGYFIYLHIRDNQVLNANVTVAGVHVQGQTRKDAIAAVNAAFERNYIGKELTVTVGEHTLVLNPETSAITMNVEAAVDAALKHSSDSEKTEVFDITKFISLNKSAVMKQLQEVAGHYQSTLKQHSYTVTGTVPADLTAPLPEEGQVLTVTIGTPGINIDVNMLYDAVVCAYGDNLSTMEYAFPINSPDSLNWEQIYLDECIPVIEASIDSETFQITEESTGYGFIPSEAEALVADAKPGDTIEIPFKILTPTTTKDMLEADLFKDILGEMSASAGYNADRNVNLRLACEKINNVIVMPGEVFSYNEALGERNKENGWKPGGTYVGKELVMTYGGGICQVSSALYYATVLADLEIVERDCHAYLPSYIPYSTDATVSWGWIDFRFRNNTDKPIRIEAQADGSKVTVKVTGTDERDYYVKFISETVEWLHPPVRYVEVPEDDNPNGYVDGQVLEGGTTGAVSKSYRNKYDKQTNELISSTLENHDSYYVDERVVVKIIPSEKPTEAPTDAPTAPPTDAPTDTPTNAPTDTPTEPEEDIIDPPGDNIGEDNGQ